MTCAPMWTSASIIESVLRVRSERESSTDLTLALVCSMPRYSRSRSPRLQGASMSHHMLPSETAAFRADPYALAALHKGGVDVTQHGPHGFGVCHYRLICLLGRNKQASTALPCRCAISSTAYRPRTFTYNTWTAHACLPACLFWSLSRLLAMVLVTQLRCTWPPDQPGHRAAPSRRLASSSITLLDRTSMSTFR